YHLRYTVGDNRILAKARLRGSWILGRRLVVASPNRGERAGEADSPTPLLLQRLHAGPGNLRALLGRDTGDADATDERAIDDDGNPALHGAGAESLSTRMLTPPLFHGVLEDLGGSAEGHRRVGLLASDFDASELRPVQAREHDEVATGVQDGDDD